MDYKLAKQLKEAGFPQEGYFWLAGEGEIWTFDKKPDNAIVMPSLSELIKACGDDFDNLEYIKNGGIDGNEKLFWANGTTHGMGGETPEEAVTRLWIALNG